MRVDHHPGGGHWFAAGLSPNVSLLSVRNIILVIETVHILIIVLQLALT